MSKTGLWTLSIRQWSDDAICNNQSFVFRTITPRIKATPFDTVEIKMAVSLYFFKKPFSLL